MAQLWQELLELQRQSWFVWAAALALGFPTVAIALSQLNDELIRRQHPLIYTVGLLRNWLIPSVVLYLLLVHVVELEANSVGLKLLLTLVLIGALYLLLSFINGFVFGAAQGDTWRSRTPRLLRELVIVFLVALGTAVVLAQVWGRDLGALAAALGLGSIVLGFALQGTLGNVMSGIALLMERPFSEGDWIELGAIEGKVVEINWRAVRILNRKKNLVIVPHTVVAQETLVNNSTPLPLSGHSVEVGFSYSHPPNQVKQVLRQAALSTPGILHEPAPVLRTLDYGDSAINYQVLYWIEDHGDRLNIRERFMTRVWYGAQRHGLNIPFPIRTLYHFNGPKENTDPLPETLARHQARSPLIHELLEQEGLNQNAQGVRLKHFGAGEQIIAEGERNRYLYVILSGTAQLTVTKLGEQEEVMQLSRGELFGAFSLLSSQPSPARVTAHDDLLVLSLNSSLVQQLIEQRPSLALDIGQVIEMRRRAIGSGEVGTLSEAPRSSMKR